MLHAAPHVGLHDRELLHRLGWFIRVRWLLVVGLAAVVLVSRYALRVDFPAGGTVAVGAVVLGYNVLFVAYHRLHRRRAIPRLTTSGMEAAIQIGLDLLALTTLVHLTGGVENPFAIFFLFHAVVGSTLLTRGEAWAVGFAAYGLFLALVALEYAGVLPHRHVDVLSSGCVYRNVPWLAVSLLAFGATLFSIVSVTCSIVTNLRKREQQLVVTQAALVAKSNALARANADLTEQQKQLVQTEKQASLGQLVAGIAHEINNPIQFIHANMAVVSEALGDLLPVLDAQSAAQPGLRVARLEYPLFRRHLPVLLRDMSDGAARIGAIVRDLKTFARRDEERLDEHVDLNEVVRTSVRLLHGQLKRLRVVEELEPDLPRLEGNLTQLEQVVVNVVQNATQALEGRADGLIRVTTRLEPGALVRLSIEDNGPGIAPEVRDRIFDPFFTTKQRAGGTGLGLSITYGIVERHRGRIEVETEVGAGTTFHFLLPLKRNGAP